MRIFVCSPLRGDYEQNIVAARNYCKQVVNQGHRPFAPHLLYPQFLDDTDATDRAAGIAMAVDDLAECDELWAFGDRVSEGMAHEIALAKSLGIPVRSHAFTLQT